MVALRVSQKSLTKHSTLYRWNGLFGHLSEAIKNQKYQFWTFWMAINSLYEVSAKYKPLWNIDRKLIGGGINAFT